MGRFTNAQCRLWLSGFIISSGVGVIPAIMRPFRNAGLLRIMILTLRLFLWIVITNHFLSFLLVFALLFFKLYAHQLKIVISLLSTKVLILQQVS